MKFRFEDSKTKVTGYNNNAVIYATVYGTLAVSVNLAPIAKEVVNEILQNTDNVIKVENVSTDCDEELYYIKSTANLSWDTNATEDSEDPTEAAIEKARGKTYTFLEKFIALLDKHMPYFLNSHEPLKIELPAAVYRDIINKLNK